LDRTSQRDCVLGAGFRSVVGANVVELVQVILDLMPLVDCQDDIRGTLIFVNQKARGYCSHE